MCLTTHHQDLCLSEWWKSNPLVHYNVFICKIKSISLEISARWSLFISNAHTMALWWTKASKIGRSVVNYKYIQECHRHYTEWVRRFYRKTVYCEQALCVVDFMKRTERNVVFLLKIECWVRLCGHREQALTYIYRAVRSIAICERISDFHSLAVFFTWMYLKNICAFQT